MIVGFSLGVLAPNASSTGLFWESVRRRLKAGHRVRLGVAYSVDHLISQRKVMARNDSIKHVRVSGGK